MINRLVSRVKYLLQNDPSLKGQDGKSIFQEIKEVDDLDGYKDMITKYPAIGISRGGGEYIEFQPDNRGIRNVVCTLGIRVYTKSESSPEGARKVLDITTWKVAQALLKNPTLYYAEFGPDAFLQDSNVARIVYGSNKYDKVFYEYATILFDTSRAEFDPEPDTEYYDVLRTMINTSFTGGNTVFTETTE